MNTKNDDELQASGVVRQRLGGISDTALANRVKRGLLPEPLRIAGRNYWRKSAVDAIVAGQCPREPVTT